MSPKRELDPGKMYQENSRCPDDWQRRLLEWYEVHHRVLPWRTDPSPYRIWVSEIMLQQTQVNTVIPYFSRFMETLPTVRDLAGSSLERVLKLWEGLGYYSRARNMHRTARFLIAESNGDLPGTFQDLKRLPGIGEYTAAAIASIAFGQAVPVVDGNVLRVFSRFWGIEDDIRTPAVRKMVFERLSPLIRKANPAVFNQAIMELGALLCRPASPCCRQCPLSAACIAFNEHCTERLPRRSKKSPIPHYDVAVGLLRKGSQILIARRKEDGMLGGLWELPGGKCRKSHAMKAFLMAKIRDECGYEIEVGRKLGKIDHGFSHFKITIHVFECSIESGKLRRHPKRMLKWVKMKNLKQFPFSSASKKVIGLAHGESANKRNQGDWASVGPIITARKATTETK